MKDFAEKLINDIQNSILKDVQKTAFLKVDFNSKKTIPTEFIESAWRKVDWDSVLMRVTENLETRICNAIVSGLESELKTDVKKLMSVSGVREKLRMQVYPELMKVLDGKE